ncbi:MAG TPA: NUDIX hydrolase [Edaphocola sp.]|nr:NUDIX hydrolase [Edaphocola sp.]
MELKFNVRVYGLVINSKNEVLLSFEQYKAFEFTKFPGGGLDYGEGTIDGLKREFEEELGISPFNFRHFYTTDFFQKSVVNDNQIVSIYYLVDLPDGQSIPQHSDTGTLFYQKIEPQLLNVVNLPIDKVVAKMLIEQFLEQ